MEESIIRNKRHCCCQCHFPRTLCCPMNYCCSCIYLLNDSSPNLNSKMYNYNDSEPLLIPKKEKELFLRSEKSFTKNYSIMPNNKINNINVNNSMPHFDKINNNHFPTKSNNLHLNLEMEEYANNKKKAKDEIKENINDNIITNNIEIPNNKFKKIVVNKYKNDRTNTCPVSYKTNKKKRIIDMNNCIPIIHTKKEKAKYINNYEINNNKTRNNNELFINKTIIDNTKYKNNKIINATNHSEEKRFNLNSMLENKLKMGDLNDDIIETKPNSSTIENNGNRVIIENLKNEIDKAKQIIRVLKNENEKLKIALYYKEQNINKNQVKNVIKLNKSTNTQNYNENEKDKNKKEKEYIDKELFEKEVNNLQNEISEVTFKLNEYENFVSILKKRNNEQEKIIKKKDKEIMELMFKLESIEKENKNKLNELNIRSIEMIKEKDNISSDYKLNNDTLKQEIIKLQEMLQNKNNRIKELEIKIKYEKNFDHKKQKLLELLFEFYVKMKKIINFDKFKESLRDILAVMSVDEFETKLNQVGKKIKQIIDDIQIKYGHCFACDIACCTSHVDKLKTFRKNHVKK